MNLSQANSIEELLELFCSKKGITLNRLMSKRAEDIKALLSKKDLIKILRDKYILSFREIAHILNMNMKTAEHYYYSSLNKKVVVYRHKPTKRSLVVIEEDRKAVKVHALNPNGIKEFSTALCISKKELTNYGWERGTWK